jgi:16S rRNA (adenine1518-N6/adenine1519-N6)-dimethyltransferase
MKKRKSHKKGARLGQHLLTNPRVAEAVAEAASVTEGDRVVEIGPGTGILTAALLEKGARVIAIEKDPGMVSILKERFRNEIAKGTLTVIEADIRDLAELPLLSETRVSDRRGEYKVAANIPYYITGELIRMFLTASHQPSALAFLVQKEVAERIARAKKESILSLSVKAYGSPKYVRTVTKGNFSPAPSVDSAILAVLDISRKNFKNVSEEKFFAVVKAGFAQKRKALAGNLKKIFGERSESALAACGIAEKARAEDVSLQKWLALATQLSD